MRRSVVVLLLAIAAPAAAQRGDTTALGLQRALEIARAANPEYRRVVNNLDLNGPQTWSTWSGAVLPSVSVLLNTGYSGNLQKQGIDPFGNPVINPNAEYVNFSNTRQGIGLNWQMQGLSALTRARQQRLANGQRDLEEELASEALRVQVERRFFDALEQEELLAAAQTVAAAVGTDQETAERLFELALRSRIDVLQAELEVQTKNLAVRQQAGSRDQARLALRTVLGQADLPPVKPEPTSPPVFDPAILDAEALVQRAIDESGAVRRQETALQLADANVAFQRGSYWPSLSASFQLSRNVTSRQSTGSLFSVGSLPDRYFSLQLSIPFFNNAFGNRAQVVGAEVARDNQRDALRQAQLETEQAARSALVTLRNAWESIQIAERALTIAGEALELAREEYRLGTRSFDALQQSVASEANARRLSIQARYGFVDALLDLEMAVGGPVR